VRLLLSPFYFNLLLALDRRASHCSRVSLGPA
jgi:hypothetical protein